MGAVVVDGSGTFMMSADGVMSVVSPYAVLAPASQIGERPRTGSAIVGEAVLGPNHYELINDVMMELTW